MAQIDALFKAMVDQSASDLHLTSGEPPYFRVHGEILRSPHKVLSHDEIKTLIFEILTDRQRALFSKEWELDFGYQVEGLGRFRCNIFIQRRGLGAAFRSIPTEVASITELGLPISLEELTQIHKGLIVITGATGSGKSTTLAALIDHINKTQSQHILTIEDPIEFIHISKKSLINQRELSSHTKSFPKALSAALREDPDVILIGEMRNLETIQLALTAAETGHLVFATLHTNTATRTVDRIIDVFPSEKQDQIRTMLAESLKAVIAQNLLPKVGGGRIAGIEVLINTSAVGNLIRESKTHQIASSMQTGRSQGMFTMEYYVQDLLEKGLINQETAEPFLKQNKIAA